MMGLISNGLMNPQLLKQLNQLDGLKHGRLGDQEVYLHEDHRWLLPIVFDAQERSLLPSPCTLVMFDAHHDGLVPNKLDKVRYLSAQGVTAHGLIELCANDLAKNDDDWVIAGMELGIFDHAVVFGVEHHVPMDNCIHHIDAAGKRHLIWASCYLPGTGLLYQGELSDHAKSEHLKQLWDILDWESISGKFQFKDDAPTLLLDFDLDCFSATYRSARFTWPDAVYDQELHRVSDYRPTEGWTGRLFVDRIRDRAGIITICREARCCGGENICNENLAQVLKHFFDQELQLFGKPANK
ncbi:MAG: UPF0489 family protein [Armatimonadetes bacterium]|nr:UPF0489 family protein [Armatimonadota bacterium]